MNPKLIRYKENRFYQRNNSSPAISTRKSGDPDFRGEKFSNATHRSTTDPEAGLFRKGRGKEAKLSYLAHNLIDVRSGIILEAMATVANGAMERTAALEILKKARPFLASLSQEEQKCFFLGDGNYTAETSWRKSLNWVTSL